MMKRWRSRHMSCLSTTRALHRYPEKLLHDGKNGSTPRIDHHHEHQDAGRQQQRSDHDAGGHRHQVASKFSSDRDSTCPFATYLSHLGKDHGDAPDQPGIEPVERGIHALAGCVPDRPQVTRQSFATRCHRPGAAAIDRTQRNLDETFARWRDRPPPDQGVIHSVSPIARNSSTHCGRRRQRDPVRPVKP